MPAAIKEKSLDDLLSPQTTLLRPHQRKEWEREIQHTDQLLAQNAASEKKFLQNAVRIRQQNEQRKAQLATQTPRPLTGAERDRLVSLRPTLLARVQDGAPTRQEQYAKPNAVPVDLKDRIRRWHTRSKADLLQLKKVDQLLNPDSDDRNLTHTDKYLPDEGPRTGYRSDRYGAFSLSPLAKINFDEIDWTGPEGQEVNAEIARLIAEGKIRVRTNARAADIARRPEGDVEVKDTGGAVEVTIHREGKPKRELTPKQRAAVGRMRAARLAKIQERKAG